MYVSVCVYDGGSAGVSTDHCSVYMYIIATVIIFFQSVLLGQSYSLRFFFFFGFFQDYRCPCARFPAILDSSKDVFFLRGHVLGLSIICSESSDNGGCWFG